MAADGDTSDAVVITEYHQIADTIAFSKANVPSLKWADTYKTPQNRKRMILACSCAILIGVIKGKVDIGVKEGLGMKDLQFPNGAEITQ